MTDRLLNSARLLADIAFGQALESGASSESLPVAAKAPAKMQDGAIEGLIELFESAAKNEDGIEVWYARDLLELLGYDDWQSFSAVINRAKKSCQSVGQSIDDHFTEVRKVASVGTPSVEDVRLDRYAWISSEW